MDLRFYLSLFLRRLPWFLLLLAIGTAVGMTVARVLPPVYIAQARLLYESEQIPGNLAASTVQTQATEQIQIIQQRILTRATLLDLANRLQIYPPRAGVRPLGPDEVVADLRSRIQIVVNDGARQAARRGPAQATIITVSFPARTAAQAAAVTNELVTLILDENVRLRTAVAGQTLDFFEQEVARLDRELALRGQRILDFKNANLETLPDSLEFRRRQQATEQERLVQIERTEAGLLERRARLVELYETTGQAPRDPAVQMTPEQRQLQALRDELSRTLAVLSPQNPRVKMIEAQIASLEAVVAGQTPGPAAGGDTPAAPTTLAVQLADIDGQLAFLADDKARIRARLDALQRSIEATPAVTIALETLERDYNNIRLQYDQAVAARARAATGETIEAMARGQRITVIEQAVPPRAPARPNRLLIAAGGAAAGAALGLALVILLEVMNRAIRRPQDLTARLGITAFGVVPYQRTRGEAVRRGVLIGAAMLVAVAVLPAGIWAIDTYYRPLDQIIDQVARASGLEEALARLRGSDGG